MVLYAAEAAMRALVPERADAAAVTISSCFPIISLYRGRVQLLVFHSRYMGQA